MKNAYPNFAPDSIYIKPMYNLNKWLEAMREIYTNVHFGNSLKESFGTVTSNWDTVEKRDFQSWMDYYQSNNQNKYKKANFYVNDNIPGYFLPNMPNKSVPSPIVSPDVSEPMLTVQHAVNDKVSQEEKRKKMEDQRKKIIGRLNAAVKHLTSHEGHMLAGEEFDKLLAGMYELIKQFQTVNKVSLSNKLYYDLIIRQANKLSHAGFGRSAGFLTKFAQNASGKLDASGPIPVASVDSGTAGGTLTNTTAPLDAIAPPPGGPTDGKEPEKKDDALDELFDNLETAGLTDSNFSDEDENELDDDISLDDDLLVEAQLAPEPPGPMMPDAPSAPPAAPSRPIRTMPEAPIAPEAPEDLEVSLPEQEDIGLAPEKNIDAIIDNALANISIKDVVRKIEDVNAIFQNRTIARELSVIDLMLSTLGLSSYFNNLSEIIQKNHEASNYSISRLSDILTKLRGAISTETIDVKEPGVVSPEVQQLQQKLQNEKNREEDRKEKRKQLQNDELDTELQERMMPQQSAAPATPAVPPNEEIANVPTELV